MISETDNDTDTDTDTCADIGNDINNDILVLSSIDDIICGQGSFRLVIFCIIFTNRCSDFLCSFQRMNLRSSQLRRIRSYDIDLRRFMCTRTGRIRPSPMNLKLAGGGRVLEIFRKRSITPTSGCSIQKGRNTSRMISNSLRIRLCSMPPMGRILILPAASASTRWYASWEREASARCS